MNGPFTVGEIVEFRVPPHLTAQTLISNGTEVEIIEGPKTYLCLDGRGWGIPGPVYGYVVAYRHWRVVVEPPYLHRRPQPVSHSGEHRIRALFTATPAPEWEAA